MTLYIGHANWVTRTSVVMVTQDITQVNKRKRIWRRKQDEDKEKKKKTIKRHREKR